MKKNSFLLSALFLVGISLQLFAQIPSGYYNPAEGTKKEQLKTALHQIIKDADVLKYGSGDGYTWEGFYQADRLTGNEVFDRYSNIKRYFNGSNSVSGMHIEHSFANSWWGGIKNQAYKDLHHLYPADGTANMRKSNHPIGIVSEEVGEPNGVIKVGWSASRPGERIKAWEPADEYKGDFARTYMYMVTCYEDYADLWKSEGLNMLDNNTYPVFEKWAIELLLEWNEQDQVDEMERTRNETVYAIQGNRNPFIDHPELAGYIWGKDTLNTFYTQPGNTEPEIFTPASGSEIDFGLQALSVDVDKKIVIRGRNLQSNLNLALSNDAFILSKQMLTPGEVEEGTVIRIKANPKATGELTSVLTLAFDGKEEQVNVKVDFWDGIPAYEAKDIVCNAYQKYFTASWMAMPGVTSYQLNVYTQDGNLSGYPKTVENASEFKVTGVAAETVYFYTVQTDDLGVSNVISVMMPKAKPDFSANNETLRFITVPERASNAIMVQVTMKGTETNQLEVSSTWPFEISTDGNTWENELLLNSASSAATFYIRMSAVDEDGDYEEEAILKTQGAEDIIITLMGAVDASKAFFEDFESGSKTSYAEANLNLFSGTWKFSEALIGTAANDKKNNEKSVRLRHNSGVFGTIEMLEDKNNGIGNLSFYAGAYGTDAVGSIAVEYSVNAGEDWIIVPNGEFAVTKEWIPYNFPLNIKAPARIRIRKTDASSSSTRRINIDDVCMTDYDDGTTVNATSADDYKVYAQKNKLHIYSDKEAAYSIYSLQGVLIRQGNLNIGETTCVLPSGAYVVRIERYASVVCL